MTSSDTPEERARLKAQAILGIEALIDEATGYQNVRGKRELRDRYAELGGEEQDYMAPDYPPDDASEPGANSERRCE